MTKKEIVDSIYNAYGTDSGILFGITEKGIVEAIVEFTLNRIDRNQKKEDTIKELLEAIQFYQKGVSHFFNCINWGSSFLDAEAIQFMNDHGIKFSKAIAKHNQ